MNFNEMYNEGKFQASLVSYKVEETLLSGEHSDRHFSIHTIPKITLESLTELIHQYNDIGIKNANIRMHSSPVGTIVNGVVDLSGHPLAIKAKEKEEALEDLNKIKKDYFFLRREGGYNDNYSVWKITEENNSFTAICELSIKHFDSVSGNSVEKIIEKINLGLEGSGVVRVLAIKEETTRYFYGELLEYLNNLGL